MIRYAFHPEARVDLDEIWEFIRADNLDAADNEKLLKALHHHSNSLPTADARRCQPVLLFPPP
jgi:plasmid stabilization system protein ParE